VVRNGQTGSTIELMKSTMGLTQAERTELSQWALTRSGRADDGRRARLILLLEAAHTWARSVTDWTATMR
jgi:hypothetical protein